MRERILQYLEQAHQPVPADQILLDVLKTQSPNSPAADRVLGTILAGDTRFRRVKTGFWGLSEGYRAGFSASLPPVAILHLQSARAPSSLEFVRGAVHAPESGASWEFELAGPASPAQLQALGKVQSQLRNRLLVVWSPNELRRWRRLLRKARPDGWEGDVLCLRDLARSVLRPASAGLCLEDLSARLEISPPDMDRPAAVARFLSVCLTQLLAQVPSRHLGSLEDLCRWIKAGEPRIDFSRFGFGHEFLRQLPDGPGVYIMRNRAGRIVYVGKAGNLRRRVRSYFAPHALRDPKAVRICNQLYSLDIVPTKSEVEALLLEVQMIRDFHPAINTQCEVHESRTNYGKQDNALLLVADRAREKAQIYLLRNASFVGRHTATLGRNPSRKLLGRIRKLYFSSPRTRRTSHDTWETEIVSRWLRSNRRRLNLVNVDEAGSYESVERQVTCYLRDPGLLSQKVYYR